MEVSTSYVNIAGVPQLLGLKIRGVQNTTRIPAHFVLLLDTSGSMEMDGRLDSVKRCAKYLLNFLNEADRISIVHFSDNANITVNCQKTVSENRMVIEGHIDGLRSGGSTNLSAGLLKVREVLATSPSDLKTGLVILTDGFANMGVHDPSGLRSIVSMIRQSYQNLSVNCVGYGFDHAGDLLRSIALEGGGSYNIVNSQEHVGPVFGEILGGLVSCVAQNVEITYPREYENYSSYISRDCGSGSTDGNRSANSTSRKLFIGDVYSEAETIVLLGPSHSSVGPAAVVGVVGGAVVGAVTLNGFNCIQMEDISVPLQWSSTAAAPEDQAPYKMYYIRWSLAKILEKALDVSVSRENLLSDIDALERLLEGEGEMVTLIRNEFVSARAILRSAVDIEGVNDTSILQRSMYLASGRGGATQFATPTTPVHANRPRGPPPLLRRSTRNNSPDPVDVTSVDVATVVAAPPGESPFMNAVQRSITRQMTQMSSE